MFSTAVAWQFRALIYGRMVINDKLINGHRQCRSDTDTTYKRRTLPRPYSVLTGGVEEGAAVRHGHDVGRVIEARRTLSPGHETTARVRSPLARQNPAAIQQSQKAEQEQKQDEH